MTFTSMAKSSGDKYKNKPEIDSKPDRKKRSRSQRIGKPLKSKKHKKLKPVDPFNIKSNADPRHMLKNAKINSRPKNMGQEIPRSALELQKLMNSKNIGKKRKNKYHKDHARQPIQEKGMEKVVQPVPTFKQKMGESNNSYFNRMDKEVQAAKQRAEFEVKWDVEVTQQRDNKVYVKPATPLESVQRKTKQKQRVADKKKNMKSAKKQKQAIDFTRTDKIEFGEVAMQPPKLTSRPRKAPDSDTQKPGRKPSLLLREIVRDNSDGTASSVQRQLGRTVPRRALPAAEQRRLDAERERVIQLYRKQKGTSSLLPASSPLQTGTSPLLQSLHANS